jgi:hypothetical protein
MTAAAFALDSLSQRVMHTLGAGVILSLLVCWTSAGTVADATTANSTTAAVTIASTTDHDSKIPSKQLDVIMMAFEAQHALCVAVAGVAAGLSDEDRLGILLRYVRSVRYVPLLHCLALP